MSNLHREPSIDTSYQVSVHWQTVAEEKIFLKKFINQKKRIAYGSHVC
jgi:hypothetical protein